MERKIWLDVLVGLIAGIAIGLVGSSVWLTFTFKQSLDTAVQKAISSLNNCLKKYTFIDK